MTTTHCTACGRPIIWTISPAGENLCVDARPVVAYALQEAGPTPRAVRWQDLEPAIGQVYISHWLTCPELEKVRRPKPPTPLRPRLPI